MQVFTIAAALSALLITTYAMPKHPKQPEPPKKPHHTKVDTCTESTTTTIFSTSGPTGVSTTTTFVPTFPPTSTTTSTPTSTLACSQYTVLPSAFTIQDTVDFNYFQVTPNGNGTFIIHEVSVASAATTFFPYIIENTSPEYLDGESLLAFNQTNAATGESATYSAYINGQGSAITFYNIDISPATIMNAGNLPVSALDSFESCEIVFGAIMEHDSSDVSVCNGTVYMGQTPGACTSITTEMMFSPV